MGAPEDRLLWTSTTEKYYFLGCAKCKVLSGNEFGRYHLFQFIKVVVLHRNYAIY